VLMPLTVISFNFHKDPIQENKRSANEKAVVSKDLSKCGEDK